MTDTYTGDSYTDRETFFPAVFEWHDDLDVIFGPTVTAVAVVSGFAVGAGGYVETATFYGATIRSTSPASTKTIGAGGFVAADRIYKANVSRKRR